MLPTERYFRGIFLKDTHGVDFTSGSGVEMRHK